MQPYNLFKYIESIPHDNYKTTGDNVQYLIKVFDDEKRIRLIFEQTYDKEDNKNNFNFLIKSLKYNNDTLYFVKGWYNAYFSASKQIKQDLISVIDNYPDYTIEICGWSYGGAMSILAAFDLYISFNIQPIVTTFGSPKCLFGNKTIKIIKSMCKQINQYAHINDPITKLPPFPFYKHLCKIKLGRWIPFGLFNFNKYHFIYGDENLYN